MRDSAVQTTPSSFPKRLQRILAGAISTVLVAGGLVAVAVAAPLVQAPSASAAANFQCGTPGSPQLYLTSNVANERRIFQLNANDGATTVAYAPNPAIAAGTLNQLATSRDGTQMFWTNGATDTSTIYEYTPGNDASAGVLETTARGTAAASGNTMGGYDLSTNRYIFGGATFSTTGPTNLVVHSYNPAGNGVAGTVATITLPNAAGGNGDLAFSPAGTMYVVTGGNASQTNAGVDDAQLYRVTGGIPTSGTTNLTAVPLGGRIDDVRGLNSIAFGADGYLYLFGTNPATAAAQLIKVNPSNGNIVSRIAITGATTGATDFASCASPSTVRGDVVLDEPRQDPADQFEVVIGGGGLDPADPSTTGTTTGSGSEVTNSPVTGPVIVLPGDTVTVDQRPAPGSVTPGPDYAQEWVCRDTAYGNRIVSSGFGPQASFTMPQNPAIGSNVVCSFSSQEAISSATIDKVWVDNGPIAAIGQRIDYTITVTNTGNVPLQDLVVTDPAPGLTVTCPMGSAIVNPIGQFNTVNTVTCTASRAATAADFQGEGPVPNTATAAYRTQQPTPNGEARTMQDSADFTPNRDVPASADDSDTGNAIGEPVRVDVVANDPGADPATVRIIDPATGQPLAQGESLTVDGEGEWTVDPTTGAITFTPEPGFSGDPTPIQYVVAGPNGLDSAPATVTVDYAPGAVADVSNGNPLGQPVTVPVTDNDLGGVVPGTVQIIDPATGLATPGDVLVDGGTWSVDPATGGVVFTPNQGYTGNPAPIGYQVEDAQGNTSQSTVTVTFQPVGVDDLSQGNAAGTTVTLTPLANDQGVVDPATFAFVDPATGLPLAPGAPLVIDGEGTWTFDPATGVVAFAPEEGFLEDPTPVDYVVSGAGGDTGASITVEYSPLAVDDASLGNTIGDPVTVLVLDNDNGDLDPASVVLIDPSTGLPLGVGVDLVIDGQGTWSVDPETGAVTFEPEVGYEGDPTPVQYRVTDVDGETTTATVTVGYVPVAVDDSSLGNTIGDEVVVDVLDNDAGVLDPATVAFIDPATGLALAPGVDLVVEGEGTWSIDPATGFVTFAPEEGYQGDPTPVDYQVADLSGDLTSATITVGYLPVAIDDSSLGNTIGDSVPVDVLVNDAGVFDLATLALIDPETGEALEPGAELVVDGEGTWSIDPATGIVTFAPEEGYQGDPTPVDYQVADLSGDLTSATITVGYLPVAQDDEDLGNTIGDAVTVDVLANDAGVFDPATVAFIDPATGLALAPGADLEVDGQGTWSIDPETGEVTFAPEEGYQGDPTPVGYQVADLSGDVTGATITVGYLPVAADDLSSGNTIGQPAIVDVLANDAGVFDPATVAFIDPATGLALAPGADLVVEGEGTWSIDPATGVVTFAPEEGYQGDPTPVDYQVADLSGDLTSATITVDYQPVAVADESLGNELGATVTLPVLDNDSGDLDPATVAIVDPATGEPLAPGEELVVEGEGTWSIDPETGAITFTPQEGFLSDPTPIAYVVEDRSGTQTGATVTVDYLQTAADDALLDQPITQPVTVPVLDNDRGDLDPATLALIDPATGLALEPGASLVVPGEGTWTIDPVEGTVTFAPESGYLGDPTPVGYQVADRAGDVVSATVTVSYLPVANDDEDLANAFGEPVVVDVLANDVGDFLPETVSLFDPAADGGAGAWLEPGVSLIVPGQGTWSIDQATGAVTFTPEVGYGGDPDPVQYRVTDSTGDTVQATITITYGPTAVDDQSLRNAQGTTVTVDVLANDLGQFDPSSVRIVSGDQLVTELVVAGQGTWLVDPTTGAITFTPASGFTGNPTPIAYQVTDVTGDVTGAIVTITYLPQANDDRSEGNAPGTAVTVDPLANDAGDLDPTTVEIRDPETGEWGKTVVVPGEGTWTVDPVTGAITFTPERGFTGDPTPITYRVTDVNGEVTQATVSIDYAQIAGVPGVDLPRTGAELALWSLVAGLGLLLAGAVVWLIRRRRSEPTGA